MIDYTKEDFIEASETYDIIFDSAVGVPFSKCKNALKPGGRLLLMVADLPHQLLYAVWGSRAGNKKVFAGHSRVSAESLQFLKRLCEAGEFKPVIDQVYPLERIAEAHARVDTGRKRGSVVITVKS